MNLTEVMDAVERLKPPKLAVHPDNADVVREALHQLGLLNEVLVQPWLPLDRIYIIQPGAMTERTAEGTGWSFIRPTRLLPKAAERPASNPFIGITTA
jgi:hypothetical protein